MKSFKFVIPALALAVMASTATTLNAQEKKGRGGMNPEARVEQLDKALTLTAEQKAKITKIYQDIQAAPQEERRAKMQGAHDQIRAVLNADQQKKFDALPQGGGDGKGGGKKKKDQ